MTTEDSGIPAATAEDHPDAELLRLKREIENASNAGNAAATDEEAEPFLDLATDLRHRLAEIPAHTLDGVIAKFDDYRCIHEGGATSVWDEDLLRTISEGLERLKPSADAKLFALEADAALQDLWREYQQCLKDWGPDETPEDEKARDRSFELERQIVETPAQSIFGVAVKLWIATHDNLPYKRPEYTDEKALVGACDDAVRLAGIGGAA